MAIQVKHATQSVATPAGTGEIARDEWNEAHTLTAAAGKVLGTLVGSTTVSELPIAVDSDGDVGIGCTPDSGNKLQVQPSSASGSHIAVGGYDTGSGGTNLNATIGSNNYNNDGYGEGVNLQYARGTKDSPAAVQNGDEIGYHSAVSYDGSSFINRAWMFYHVDGAVSTGTVPTAIGFNTGSSASPVERLRVSSTGQLSAVVPGNTTLYPGFMARAWVNFNGTGTIAIRASGNVTSLTDIDVGQYYVNFTTSMPDTNYTVVNSGYDSYSTWTIPDTTARCIVTSEDVADTLVDDSILQLAVFR
jgi:hypothetical protein